MAGRKSLSCWSNRFKLSIEPGTFSGTGSGPRFSPVVENGIQHRSWVPPFLGPQAEQGESDLPSVSEVISSLEKAHGLLGDYHAVVSTQVEWQDSNRTGLTLFDIDYRLFRRGNGEVDIETSQRLNTDATTADWHRNRPDQIVSRLITSDYLERGVWLRRGLANDSWEVVGARFSPRAEGSLFDSGAWGTLRAAGPIEGVLAYGDARIFDLLRSTLQSELAEATVRQKKINGRNCLGVAANVNGSHYEIWIDPNENVLLQAHVKGKMQRWQGEWLLNVKNTMSLRDSSSALPSEYEIVSVERESPGGREVRSTIRSKVTQLQFDPNFKSMGAFGEIIPDGTVVELFGSPLIKYKWDTDGHPQLITDHGGPGNGVGYRFL